MTAITHISPTAPLAETPHMVNGDRWLVRSMQRMAGMILIMAAAGLWVVPGSVWDADILATKFVLTILFGVVGLAVLQMGRAQPLVQVEIDTLRREVRLVRGKGQHRTVVSRTAIADLGPAEQHGTMVRLWARDGSLVAEVAMTDPEARRGLTGALRDAGKL